MLPRDPMILLSFVNTRLRDEDCDLSALCRELDEDADELERTLEKAGFRYDPEQNRFR